MEDAMNEAVTPTAIERIDASQIAITWSDGQRQTFSARRLREACPCATCREKQSAPPKPTNQLTVLSAAEAQPLTIRGMRPVGSYAYNIVFSDGHSSGLFSFDRLRSLGE